MEAAAKVLGAVKAEYGTYYVFGNHDYNAYTGTPAYSPEELCSTLESSGIVVLKDRVYTVNDELTVIGRTDASVGSMVSPKGRTGIEELCRERGVAVEMCPTSNFQTKAVEKRSDYPIRRFLEQGLAVTVNTDNRTVSGTSMTEELFLLHSQFGVTKDEALRMTENAVLAAFAEEEVKRELLEKLADFRKKSGQPDGR